MYRGGRSQSTHRGYSISLARKSTYVPHAINLGWFKLAQKRPRRSAFTGIVLHQPQASSPSPIKCYTTSIPTYCRTDLPYPSLANLRNRHADASCPLPSPSLSPPDRRPSDAEASPLVGPNGDKAFASRTRSVYVLAWVRFCSSTRITIYSR